MNRLSNLLITLFIAFSIYSAYALGHYRGFLMNVDVTAKQARREAWYDGFQQGEDWANNKHRSNCNDA